MNKNTLSSTGESKDVIEKITMSSLMFGSFHVLFIVKSPINLDIYSLQFLLDVGSHPFSVGKKAKRENQTVLPS